MVGAVRKIQIKAMQIAAIQPLQVGDACFLIRQTQEPLKPWD